MVTGVQTCALPIYVDIDRVLIDPDNHFLQWAEPWPGRNRDGSHRDAAVDHIISATDAIALQREALPPRAFVPYPERELLLDFIAIHWARFVRAPSKCQDPHNQQSPTFSPAETPTNPNNTETMNDATTEVATLKEPHICAIADTKSFRQDLDRVLQEIKRHSDYTDMPSKGIAPVHGARRSPQRDIAIIKIQEAIMWLGMDLKAINEENPGAAPNPYPESYNPQSPVIEPTADGLKL
jgi:hypothetical protein